MVAPPAHGDIRRSKRLALVLRHRPESVGIQLDGHGWVDVDTLLTALADHGMPMSRIDLERVVSGNDQQRFDWDAETDRIRARQGHSVPVDLGLPASEPPALLYHGTPLGSLASILRTGLDRRGRHHVHLSSDVETAHRVGARRGRHVVLIVDAAAMVTEGRRFWVTDNGVWLTDHVPPEFLATLEAQ